MNNSHISPEYIKKLGKMRDEVREKLESKGLFVEDTSDQIGLSISLTQFGLSTMYATVTQEELEYFLDNDIEL